jgi:hypothetical protein
MSEAAEAVFEDTGRKYMDMGFPGRKVFSFTFEVGSPVCNELLAYKMIEPFASGGSMRFTAAGHAAVLELRDISDEADAKLDEIGRAWIKAGMPPVCAFGFEPAEKAIYCELIDRGFADWHTNTAIKLTDYGKRWILEHRSDTP